MLKKTVFMLAVTTALTWPCVVQAASLADSVAFALDTNPNVAAGKASAKAASNGVWEQRSSFFPTLRAGGRAGRIQADDDTTRASTGGDAVSWLGEGNVSLTQPLFAGFSVVNRYNAAKDREEAAAFDLGGTTEDIALRASRAHLNLMRTRELLDLATQYLSDIQSRRDNIGLMVKEGAADEAELLQADETLMAAKTTRLGYEESYRQAEADYIQHVGALPDQTLEFGEAVWEKSLPASLDAAIAEGAANNPAVKAADEIVSAMGREAQAEKGTALPRVDAELSYLEKDQHDDLGGEMMNAQAMLKMSWEFSTGGGQIARFRKGLSQREEARARKEDALRTVEHDVRQRFTSMQIVDQQFTLMREREEANQKILDNYLSQFEGGKQSNLQLIAAHTKLFESRGARTDAYYRRLLARFELLTSMGRLRQAFDLPEVVPDQDKPSRMGVWTEWLKPAHSSKP